jgi:small conductance mechanosensitive channel
MRRAPRGIRSTPVHLLPVLLVLLLQASGVGSRSLYAQEPPGPPEPPLAAESRGSVESAETGSPQSGRIAGEGQDLAAQRHLEATFGELEELGNVRVSVRAGVARLEGEVLSSEARELAETLARETAGVAVVDNRIEEVRDLRRRLSSALEKLRETSLDLVALLPLLVVAVLVVVVFFYLSGWIGRRETWLLPDTGNRFVRDLVHQAIRLAVMLVGVVLALELLDATALVGAVLGTAGVVGLALGFAFRDTAENYIASILLSLRQPFAPNDAVAIEGYEGKVVRLTSRATILLTFDGNHVRIPNSTVFKSLVVNYSQNPQRRFDFGVDVGTEEDLGQALRLGLDTLHETPGVLAEPPPSVLVEALGDSSVQLHCYAWIDQREVSLIKVKSEAIRRVKEAFDAASIAMPEPTFQIKGQIKGQDTAAEPARPAPVPKRPEPVRLARSKTEAADIGPETHIDRQVAEDRAAAGETDLLNPAAPKE